MNIVKDKRTLKAMARQGKIIFPAQFGGNSSQVDHTDDMPRCFEYHGEKFRIEYFSGSIYPFVTFKTWLFSAK